jgi:CDP-paratose synthetase
LKVLLTGASGFLGSALALHLRDVGHEVALLLRPGSNLRRLRDREDEFIVGRYGNDDEILDFVHRTQPDTVVHTACAYGRVGETTLQLTDANIRFGLSLLQALEALQYPVNFINTGTVLAPNVSPYALSKHQFADWGRRFCTHTHNRIHFLNVLLQHMYGPGDDQSKFTTHVLHACHRNDPILKLTAGEQARDFIYIADAVSAYTLLIQAAHALEPAMDIEVGSGTAPTVREFVETVHAITGSNTELQFGALPYRANEAMHCQADITTMRRLGWQPHFSLTSGIKKTLDMEF